MFIHDPPVVFFKFYIQDSAFSRYASDRLFVDWLLIFIVVCFYFVIKNQF